MFKLIAHDVANDIALVQTNFGFSVRYGLQVQKHGDNLQTAIEDYTDCLHHALGCNGIIVGESF